MASSNLSHKGHICDTTCAYDCQWTLLQKLVFRIAERWFLLKLRLQEITVQASIVPDPNRSGSRSRGHV